MEEDDSNIYSWKLLKTRYLSQTKLRIDRHNSVSFTDSSILHHWVHLSLCIHLTYQRKLTVHKSQFTTCHTHIYAKFKTLMHLFLSQTRKNQFTVVNVEHGYVIRCYWSAMSVYVNHLCCCVVSHYTVLSATASEVPQRSTDCQLCCCHSSAADVDHQWSDHHQPNKATIDRFRLYIHSVFTFCKTHYQWSTVCHKNVRLHSYDVQNHFVLHGNVFRGWFVNIFLARFPSKQHWSKQSHQLHHLHYQLPTGKIFMHKMMLKTTGQTWQKLFLQLTAVQLLLQLTVHSKGNNAVWH